MSFELMDRPTHNSRKLNLRLIKNLPILEVAILTIEVGVIPLPFLVLRKIPGSGRVGLFIPVVIVGWRFIVVIFILNELRV